MLPKNFLRSSLAVLAVATTAISITHAQEKAPAMAESDDPYLWLEEVEGERALEWVRSQNDRTLAELQASPLYEGLLEEARAILTSDERIPGAALRGGYAYNFWQDETNVRGLWRRMTIKDYVAGKSDWDTVLDLDALAEEEDENWVYKGVSCLAPAYERCIITLSRGGSDASVRREYIIGEGFVEDGFNLAEAKAGTAWLDADTMLVATDLGEDTKTDSGYPRLVQLWERGTAIEDAPVIFEGEKSDVGSFPFSVWADGKYTGGVVRARTFYESDYNTLGEDGQLFALPLPAKSSYSGYVDGKVIVSLQEDWEIGGETYKTGSVVAYDPETEKTSLIFAPSDRVAVDGVSSSEDTVFISLLDNINGKLLSFTPTRKGWKKKEIALPENGVISVSSVDDETGDMLVYYENPTTPETLFYVKKGGAPRALKSTPDFFNAEGMVTKQYEATSTDGTKIPYFVIAKESVLEAGPAPTVQYGYGGFQVSILPQYSATTGKLWLENGGVYVIANIRGGGEFGPEWHQAGLKTNRQKIYDDFYAVSEDLIAKGITTSDQLGILGGSNGGLLMGVAMTQRPDLYKAIGIGVPLLDMLRYDQLLAGASWVGEYGSPSIPEERAFLEKISPYHNVKEDVDYPRAYFFTSTKDDRVHPGHARKMAKKMEAQGHPFLYYENIEGGHGAAANQEQQAKRLALQYVYFANLLGLDAE
ncbi:prolyl oligopeptidase family protein [Parvularcula marina]|uniref:prolyl oligopeptidase family serine peptidase n=1 Tax=Parvularcula marina TaxID=2292771 RepID=UPI0035188363